MVLIASVPGHCLSFSFLEEEEEGLYCQKALCFVFLLLKQSKHCI